MAEKIRLGSHSGIMLDLMLGEDASTEQGLVWAKGVMTVGGEPLISREGGAAFDWTWIDLLEWLSKNWSTLLLEQDYPFNMTPVSILTLQGECEQRWANMPDSIAEKEEEIVYRFLARHDVAQAFKGLFLPSVYLMRQGLLMEITNAELPSTQYLPLAEAAQDLERIGQGLSERAAMGVPGTRGAQAAEQWAQRATALSDQAVGLHTGLSATSLAAIDPDSDPNFWEFNAEEPLLESELMAAARMTNGALQLEQQKQLLEQVRQLPRTPLKELDGLSAAIKDEFTTADKPYDQGHWAAGWLRHKLAIKETEAVDPGALLGRWGVAVTDINMPDSRLDALACWGPQHGPAVLLNRAEGRLPAHRHGQNSTLAHEICHLLLDRRDSLPVAEVLNGNMPERLEKRARAFAAELLLPRTAAEIMVRQRRKLALAVKDLSSDYEVSEELACWQIINSGAFSSLNETEQRWINTKVNR